jgi:hypothetical protein
MSMVDGYDDDDAPSPHNVPLPSSPPTSITSSAFSASHLQAQPSHRLTPQMTFYPSLARNDSDDDRSTPLLDPSGLDIPFGLPTPALSPNQVPAAGRSPSADPRSPIARWTRIPGSSVMELSRFVFFFVRSQFLFFAQLMDLSLTRRRVFSFFFFSGTSFLVALRLRGMVSYANSPCILAVIYFIFFDRPACSRSSIIMVTFCSGSVRCSLTIDHCGRSRLSYVT